MVCSSLRLEVCLRRSMRRLSQAAMTVSEMKVATLRLQQVEEAIQRVRMFDSECCPWMRNLKDEVEELRVNDQKSRRSKFGCWRCTRMS